MTSKMLFAYAFLATFGVTTLSLGIDRAEGITMPPCKDGIRPPPSKPCYKTKWGGAPPPAQAQAPKPGDSSKKWRHIDGPTRPPIRPKS